MISGRSYDPLVKRSIPYLCVFCLLVAVGISACTLRIGGPNRGAAPPAPTTLPHTETAEALTLPGATPPAKPVTLPPGFSIEVYAAGLDGPRMMATGLDGQVYVAERGADRIIRLPDLDGNGQADGIEVVASELDAPSSIDFHPDGSLYVGETRRILRLSEPDASGAYQRQEIVIDGLPEGGHNTRTVLFSPDGSKLYVSIGSSCNVCQEQDARRASIMQYAPDGSNPRLFARGLRNAVGMVFRPGTTELWTTNNGRDMLGDDLPPDTIQLVHQGLDYGWPYCHSGRIADPDLGGLGSCKWVAPPNVELQAHSAPLGLTFYSASQFPSTYQGNLFVAFHGSWNRSKPTGYKVVRIPFQGGLPGPVQDFATGWLVGDNAWGRPVDVLTAPDGSLLVSDDAGGIIYRIFYIGER